MVWTCEVMSLEGVLAGWQMAGDRGGLVID
jgi:hypothetical protein